MGIRHIPLFMGAIVQGMLHRLSLLRPMVIDPDRTIGQRLITDLHPLTDPITVIAMSIANDIAVNL